jgi:hypothetical protein
VSEMQDSKQFLILTVHRHESGKVTIICKSADMRRIGMKTSLEKSKR